MSNTIACGFTPTQMAAVSILYVLCIKWFLNDGYYNINTIYELLISAAAAYAYTDALNWLILSIAPKEEPTEEEVVPEEEDDDLSVSSADSSDSEWLPSRERVVMNDPPPSPVYVPSFSGFYISDEEEETYSAELTFTFHTKNAHDLYKSLKGKELLQTLLAMKQKVS